MWWLNYFLGVGILELSEVTFELVTCLFCGLLVYGKTVLMGCECHFWGLRKLHFLSISVLYSSVMVIVWIK